MSIKRNIKRKKMVTITGLSVLALTLAGCGSSGTNNALASAKNSSYGKDCKQWTQSEDGSEKCTDKSSRYSNQHFFNGAMYSSLSNMQKSSDYKTNNLKTGTGKVNLNKSGSSSSSSAVKGGSTSTGKSGFGSGGRGGSSGS
ncbi:hypothetical protein ABD91_21130 [Lysinibacillus sphaericus]|uniref:hypothetical protein n=1 Tax=Lysinibacillus sphaericus TaxID=1421 RepID=UPI0018CCAE52|nr:hypothetical protein [Lysinibacillus sphaericus]MBG9693244.1 hypothetical protein [Lysinibacillus sphaericus]